MVAVAAGTGTVLLTILVVGATGNTGKYVVQQLLDQGHRVKVIVRSKQRMVDVLVPLLSSTTTLTKSEKGTETVDEGTTIEVRNYNNNNNYNTNDDTIVIPQNLIITEGSILDMDHTIVKEHVKDVDAVVSCLGHTTDLTGIFGHATRRLVTDATKKLTTAMMDVSSVNVSKNNNNDSKSKNKKEPIKFVLMTSDGVANLDGTDSKRSYMEQWLFFLIRNMLPPHADNEDAAEYVYHQFGKTNSSSSIEWTIVRPATLLNGPITKYKLLYDPGPSVLFGSSTVTRANVAKAIVDLITNDTLWTKWKFQFPVVHDDVVVVEANVETKEQDVVTTTTSTPETTNEL